MNTKIEWSKTNQHIADELGLPIEEIRLLRKAAWHGVDWALWDSEIARQMGCSRERVRQRRQKLSAIVSHKESRFEAVVTFLLKNKKQLQNLTINQIHEKCPTKIHYSYLSKALKTAGVNYISEWKRRRRREVALT